MSGKKRISVHSGSWAQITKNIFSRDYNKNDALFTIVYSCKLVQEHIDTVSVINFLLLLSKIGQVKYI